MLPGPARSVHPCTAFLVSTESWAFPPDLQPRPDELAFDLAAALDAVVTVHAEVPDDAFTASILGTERTGNGFAARDDGLILTVGYLVTEAQTVWLTDNRGTAVQGYPVAVDFATGLALVQPLEKLKTTVLPRGSTAGLLPGDAVTVLGRGGARHALQAEVYAKREFAGYREYLLDEALFTTPLHPEWSGAALLDDRGRVCGVGSLFLQEQAGDTEVRGNMFVPIDLLPPILAELRAHGRSPQSRRAWIGLNCVQTEVGVRVVRVNDDSPAERAGVEAGDRIVRIDGTEVTGLEVLWKTLWAGGAPEREVTLEVDRRGERQTLKLQAIDRMQTLKRAQGI